MTRANGSKLNQRFNTEEAAQAFLESLSGARFTVSDIAKTPGNRNPAAPFTTSLRTRFASLSNLDGLPIGVKAQRISSS